MASTVTAGSGCNKDKAAKSEGAGGAAAACAGATFNNDNPKICLKLPAGYTARPAEDATGGGKRILIDGPAQIALYWNDGKFTEKDLGEMVANGVSGDKEVVGKGDVPGRSGLKYYHVNFKTGTMGASETYLQSKKFFYKCKVNAEKVDMPPAVEACKTLWGE